MAETNLALQLQVVDPSTDWESVMIGNSRFADDVWDLRVFILAKTTKDSQKYLNFGYIQTPNMKHTVKQYAYYKLGKTKPQTVRTMVNSWLPSFFEFFNFIKIKVKFVKNYVERVCVTVVAR